jgi:phosphate transport system ATP-binding protein
MHGRCGLPAPRRHQTERIADLRRSVAVVIVMGSMQQGAWVSDITAFCTMADDRTGHLVEMGPTTTTFTNPSEQPTVDCFSGRFA